MGVVRPFAGGDVPHVAALHRGAFLHETGRATTERRRAHEAFLRETFLEHPWYDPEIASLVYQEPDGRIVGFLGIVPRRMLAGGRPVAAAVSSQFVVDPGSRTTLAAVQLLKAYLSGPQELSIADGAVDRTRRIWEALGGATSPVHSLYWLRVLAPARLFLSRLRGRGPLAAALRLTRPLWPLADGAAAAAWSPGMRPSPPDLEEADLDLGAWLAAASSLQEGLPIRPDYDARVLAWLYASAARARSKGELARVGVRDREGRVAGWYLYYRNPGRMSEVVQLVARRDALAGVIAHLLHRAWREGAAAVTGRLEPSLLGPMSGRYWLFHRRGPWALVHSRHGELARLVVSGAAPMSLLDGEWCLNFWGEP